MRPNQLEARLAARLDALRPPEKLDPEPGPSEYVGTEVADAPDIDNAEELEKFKADIEAGPLALKRRLRLLTEAEWHEFWAGFVAFLEGAREHGGWCRREDLRPPPLG